MPSEISLQKETEQAVMPDLSHGFSGFRHTVDSALEVLSELGVPASRVSLRMAGAGLPSRWIADQFPAPGTPLDKHVIVSLGIAGFGFCNSLPVGMWDQGGESEPGTTEMLDLLDDPLQKAAHWIREGARLFDISSNNPDACLRWISLFGLQPESWPVETWYTLSLLLPSLQRFSGTEAGICLALNLLLKLPLQEIVYKPSVRYQKEEHLSLLGKSSSRLSVDCIVGDQLEDTAKPMLVLGPVSLNTYYSFQRPAGSQLLHLTLNLVMTCYERYSVSWVVLDSSQPPRLGIEVKNSRLGVNSYLGGPAKAQPKPRRNSMNQYIT